MDWPITVSKPCSKISRGKSCLSICIEINGFPRNHPLAWAYFPHIFPLSTYYHASSIRIFKSSRAYYMSRKFFARLPLQYLTLTIWVFFSWKVGSNDFPWMCCSWSLVWLMLNTHAWVGEEIRYLCCYSRKRCYFTDPYLNCVAKSQANSESTLCANENW